ncbi:hypothetical protein MTR67_035732 [Solanum verrucosum]|uniref:PB1-like domain-containing protein n=1 Tax=Solanum verrucosum TaxID=315347 RepID=A0AAF0ZKK1_SOLVR|nr:hypothetical protein MTR67_035732 [Solanum verrucosum]
MLFLVCLRLPKIVLVDLVFHYGGKWIREPKLLYEGKLVYKWEGYDSDLLSFIDITNEYINLLGCVGVQQLIVSVLSGKYYEIEGDEGIRTLLSFVNDKFYVINLFVVEDCELDVDVENITKMLETVVVIDDISTDCTFDGSENDSDTSSDNSDYNSEELEVLAQARRRVSATTIAFYFKEKLQANPKYKIKEMRVDMKTAFNIKAHFEKCKRAKRMILEDMEGSFCDDYKKLIGYANALKESNPGTDVVLKVSRNPLDEKRKFLRMYICFEAFKNGFKNGLRPFIDLDGTFLKGKAKGQLLCAIGQDSMNHFHLIVWAIVDKEYKASWV